MSQTATTEGKTSKGRYLIIALFILVAFFASYRFAAARTSAKATPAVALGSAAVAGTGVGGGTAAGTPVSGGGSASGSGAACACCGGGSSASSAPVEGAAKVEGAVQRISVDLSSGSYNPNTIKLKAGVPSEVTFGQGSGCLAQVQSQDLSFFEDLTQGPKTIKLPALKAGTYEFSCGMQMVFGKIVVE